MGLFHFVDCFQQGRQASRVPDDAALVGHTLPQCLQGVGRQLLDAVRSNMTRGFEVPVEVPGVAEVLLDPRRTWDDADAYDRQAAKLVQMFADNFAQYVPFIDDDVKAAAIG